MSTETGGPSQEEMGIKPEAKTERKMYEITSNPDGTFTTLLPRDMDRYNPDLVPPFPEDETFNTRKEAEEAVKKAKEVLEDVAKRNPKENLEKN